MCEEIYVKNAFSNGIDLNGASASVEWLDDYNSIGDMQTQTKKLNLPISCFIGKTDKPLVYKVRYFIADCEEPICGHGTLVATQFLKDKGLVKDAETVKFLPIKIEGLKPITAQINGDFISICIQTIEPKNLNLETTIAKKIIKSIPTKTGQHFFDVKNIVEGDLDYTVEIKASHYSLFLGKSAKEIIESIQPDFEAIEQIQLKSGKLCRGIDVVIKNDSNSYDYITRIFLPLGADPQYKEDPACGSGSSYVARYLKTKGVNGQLTFYQASSAGALIKAECNDNGLVKISGMVK